MSAEQGREAATLVSLATPQGGQADEVPINPEPIAEELPGTLTETAYILPDDLSFERWSAVGETLQQLERSVGFWLGDWWAYGERKWGELSAQAVKDMTGHERSTIWNYSYVARAIDSSRRREGLSFSHHYEVAKIARNDAALADELLERAVEQKLTRQELRDEARRMTRERALALPIPPDDRLPIDVTLEVADARQLPLSDGMADLIVTSPRYGLDVAYHDVEDPAEDWQAFMAAWLQEAYRVSAEHARLALNVALDSTKGGFRPIAFQACTAAEQAGWTYRSAIVWNEGNISRSVARGSLDSPAAPHIIARVEVVLLFHKGGWQRDAKGRTWDLTHREWLEWTDGLWTLPGESNPWEGFPASYPTELASRLIRLLSFDGDLVVDPFVGSGSTALAAARLGRRCIGYDISPAQIGSAKRRLAAARQLGSLGGG